MQFGSTLSSDAFPAREFDFMLSNPPYGKSWKTDLERMGGKSDIMDSRFVVEHAGDADYSLITRSSDGQMMFLANMLSKMKQDTPLGSRIAEVHNGSSLFTGDAGQGESNIRRWIIENDWLEAIVALPLNMFYNTGIATYIWVLSNRKAEHRRGRVQLIDATQWSPAAAARTLAARTASYPTRTSAASARLLPGLRGDGAVEDIPQRGLRLLEGHRGAPVAAGPSIYRQSIASASMTPAVTQRKSRSQTSLTRWRQCWAPDHTPTSTDSWKPLWRMPPRMASS